MVEHQQAIKRILHYIASTLDYDLRYERCPGASHLIGYCDSDLAGDIDMSKSISGVLFFLSNSPVSWQSLKQRMVALPSCEAEYIAATSTATQALWLAHLLGELLGKRPRQSSSRWTTSLPWHWLRTQSSMREASTSGSSTTSTEAVWKKGA
jgi:hypothetical protein